MAIKKIIKLFLMALVLFACKKSKSEKTKSFCANLSNTGLDYYHQYSESNDPKLLDSAVYYLDKSIRCNPKNISAKWNLLPVLTIQKKYKRAIKITDELYELTKSPFYLMYKASYLENTNKHASKNTYQKALDEFKVLYKKSPDSLELISEIIPLKVQLKLITIHQGIQEFDNYKKKYCNKNAAKSKIVDIHIKELQSFYTKKQ